MSVLTDAPEVGRRTLNEDAIAPILRPGRGSRWLMIALAVPVVAGLGAYGYQLVNGIGATNLNDSVFWGLYTVDLVSLIGLSYGGALVSAILRLSNARWRGPVVRIAEATALVTLVVGALFPIIHLGHPERVWELFVRPQMNSPLLWDMVAIVTYLLATVLLFGLPLVPDFGRLRDQPGLSRGRRRLFTFGAMGWRDHPAQRQALSRSTTAIAIAIIPLAVMVHTVLSYAFSLTSRPGWHSTIFGPYFVVAAVYSGVATVILAAAAYRRAYGLQAWITEEAIRLLAYIMLAVGLAYAYFTFTEITTEGYVGEQTAQNLLYTSMLHRFAPLFWTFVVLGLVVPTLLVAWRRTRTVAGITVAAALVVGGMFLKRFLLFVPPLTRPLIGGAASGYAPSWVEWTVTVGALAAVPLLLVVLFRWVPVLAADEIDELATARRAPTPRPAQSEVTP